MNAWHMLAGSANGVMSLVLPVMKYVVSRPVRLRMVVHTGTDAKILERKPHREQVIAGQMGLSLIDQMGGGRSMT